MNALRQDNDPLRWLIDSTASRRDMVERMAKDLIRFGATGDERDAIRALTWCGAYSVVDVIVMVDDARQAAVQEIVAREMAKP